MRTFDPRQVAWYEKESWAAYYQRRWLRLLRLLIGWVRSAFGLSWWQAIHVGYLLTRAQMAFAPQDNDVPLAVEYMRRAFAYLKNLYQESFDPAEAARQEVNWWVVHRRLFANPENEALIQALQNAYAAEYSVPPERVRTAAVHRAQAALYSDQWVREGRLNSDSPLLAQDEEELIKSYTALKEVVAGIQQPVASGL
jgi:hypothetical protein